MRLRKSGAVAAAVLAATLSSGAPAGADAPPINPFGREGDLHLDFPTYESRSEDDRGNANPPSGLARTVGDVNGDGRADIAMAISGPDPSWTPTTWVTFMPASMPWRATVGGPEWSGLRIVGAGRSISGVDGAGDVNGDGIGDVAVAGEGGAWVVFGDALGGTVDVANLGTRGFAITGARPCPTGDGGNSWTGIFSRTSSVLGVGDQDGDGRPDLALCDERAIRMVRTPADPAGAVVDVAGDGAGTIALGPDDASVRIDTAGDTDGDGRTDLVLAWTRDNHDGRVLGTPLPAAGTSTTVEEAQASSRGFVLTADGTYLERLTAVGDQNRDGLRDLALAVSGGSASGRTAMIAYTPPPGTRASLLPLAPSVGQQIEERGNGVSDVGDQDGDGVSDLGFEDLVRLSGSGEGVSIDGLLPSCAPLWAWGGTVSLQLCRYEYKIVGTLPDRNGDAKPEIIAIHTDPLPSEPNTTRATWRIDVFPSAVTPVAQSLVPPVVLPTGAIAFAGDFVTAPTGPLQTLAARPTVAVTDPSGETRTADGALVDAGATPTMRARVTASPSMLGLVPGRRYTYRMTLQNGRGLTGATAAASFVYRPLAASIRRGRRLSGTRRADRLVGTRWADRLSGRGGDDVLVALAGSDRLSGGPGRDRLSGGAGRDQLSGGAGRDTLRAVDGTRDVVACGAGRDTAFADRRDSVSGCERIVRGRG